MGDNSRNSIHVQLIPVWQSNLINMHRYKTRVRCSCRKCNVTLEVNVRLLMAYHGEHYSLIDKIARCRVVGCGGEVFFLASAGEASPYRPLLTR